MATISTGYTVQISGIYRCQKCGNEITCVKGDRCPPCVACKNTTFSLVPATK